MYKSKPERCACIWVETYTIRTGEATEFSLKLFTINSKSLQPKSVVTEVLRKFCRCGLDTEAERCYHI